MKDRKAIPRATVNKKGEVVCPSCGFRMPVPETHSLAEGIGICAGCKKRFLVDQDCVVAFHYFLGKRGSDHSKEMLKNRDETPAALKDLQDKISDGGIILP